jgi:hypothetical protein
MGLINWIFDIYQHTQIDKARDAALEARAAAAAIRSSAHAVDAERLERALGELALATKAIQRLLVEKQLVTPEELGAKLRQIDQEDGRADGRSPLLA